MVQDLPINDRLVIPSRELQWRFSRASGPGGQGVNTTDSRVELVFDLENSAVLGPFRRQRLMEVLASPFPPKNFVFQAVLVCWLNARPGNQFGIVPSCSLPVDRYPS